MVLLGNVEAAGAFVAVCKDEYVTDGFRLEYSGVFPLASVLATAFAAEVADAFGVLTGL